MAITSSEILRVINGPTGRSIYEQHTDDKGKVWEYRYKAPPAGEWNEVDALAVHAAEIEADLPIREVREKRTQVLSEGGDPAPIEQTQADYDRRMLGLFMTEDDPRLFLNALPFFQAVEGRGGANGNQRAAYLGVSVADYTLVANRFGDVQGAAFFINDDKGQIWDEPLPGWE